MAGRYTSASIEPMAAVANGLFGAFALEQFQPELRLQIGDPVAHYRRRSPQSARGARETAGIDDGEEEAQLVERRGAGLVRSSTFWNNLDDFIPLKRRVHNP